MKRKHKTCYYMKDGKKLPFRFNDEEFSFNMSTHGVWMMIDGLYNYVLSIDRRYRNKTETPDYCHVLIYTAYKEATKIRKWAVDNGMQNVDLVDLDKLIVKIERRRKKFRDLENEMFPRMAELCKSDGKKVTGPCGGTVDTLV